MLFLQSDNITDLYVWVDDLLIKGSVHRDIGRPSILSDSELLTILIWNTLTMKQKTIQDLYHWVRLDHEKTFPHLPIYNNFLKHCHRLIPQAAELLQQFLSTKAPLRFIDSTMLPVCKHKRADDHKVAKSLANFGKNWQGWHYGFKLHASIDHRGNLCSLVFSEASFFDGRMTEKLLNEYTKIAVGDTSYGGREMREKLWDEKRIFLLAPPPPAHKQKIAALWQTNLLSFRSKIESVFDYLKEHLHLVTSFARSIKGYFLHYIRILLGYQIMCLLQNPAEK